MIHVFLFVYDLRNVAQICMILFLFLCMVEYFTETEKHQRKPRPKMYDPHPVFERRRKLCMQTLDCCLRQ